MKKEVSPKDKERIVRHYLKEQVVKDIVSKRGLIKISCEAGDITATEELVYFSFPNGERFGLHPNRIKQLIEKEAKELRSTNQDIIAGKA